MRIAMVCPYSLSRPGGVQGQVRGLSRELEAAGHRVVVVAPDDRRPPGWCRRPAPDGAGAPAPWRFVPGRSTPVRSNGSVAPVALSPAAAWRAHRAVATFGAEVLHLHEPLAPAVGYWCLAEHRLPTVGTYHRSGGSRAYRLLGPLSRWAGTRLDVACAVSEAAAETAAAAVGGRFEILFNGVEVERFSGAEPVASPRPAILFLGRHEPRKGLAVLLEAFGRLPAGEQVLWVGGDGPETAGLRRRFGSLPGVEWLGMLGDDEVPARLAGAAVLCAPSLGGESFGMVLLEAMAAGCAVVASDIPGYRAAAGGHGLLAPPGDPEGLAGALGAVLAGAADDEARRAARRHAESWSMRRLAASYVDLYRRAVSEARRRPLVT
ncbi:MAG: glycosyltransferase family 4 protein [Acidimicrobiales bacterium]